MSAHQSIPRAEWASRYITGTSAQALADAAGVSCSSVTRHLKALGIQRNHQRGPKRVNPRPQTTQAALRDAYAARVDRFMDLALAGKSISEAADVMGVKYDVAAGYAEHARARRPELAEMLLAAGKAYQSAQNRAIKAAKRAEYWPDLKEMRERGASLDECAHALNRSIHVLRRLEKEFGGKPARIKSPEIRAMRRATAASGPILREALHKPTTPRQCLASTYDGFRCTTVFASEGPHHRMCSECRNRL